MSDLVWALVSSLWTWLQLSSLFLRYSRSLHSLFWICWVFAQTFQVWGCIVTPIIPPGPFPNFMYVVSVNKLLLQTGFHISLLWWVTCSYFMKDSGVSFGWKLLHGINLTQSISSVVKMPCHKKNKPWFVCRYTGVNQVLLPFQHAHTILSKREVW